MAAHIDIRFEEMDSSRAIENYVRKAVGRIEASDDRIASWDILINSPKRRHHHASPLLNVDIKVVLVDGREIQVEEHPMACEVQDDPYASLFKGFERIERELNNLEG